jgi:hypothetical protein
MSCGRFAGYREHGRASGVALVGGTWYWPERDKNQADSGGLTMGKKKLPPQFLLCIKNDDYRPGSELAFFR